MGKKLENNLQEIGIALGLYALGAVFGAAMNSGIPADRFLSRKAEVHQAYVNDDSIPDLEITQRYGRNGNNERTYIFLGKGDGSYEFLKKMETTTTTYRKGL